MNVFVNSVSVEAIVAVVSKLVVVDSIRRRGVFITAPELLENTMTDNGVGGLLCCWTAATDENNDIIEHNEIKIDACFEETVDRRKDDDSRQIRRLRKDASIDSKEKKQRIVYLYSIVFNTSFIYNATSYSFIFKSELIII